MHYNPSAGSIPKVGSILTLNQAHTFGQTQRIKIVLQKDLSKGARCIGSHLELHSDTEDWESSA